MLEKALAFSYYFQPNGEPDDGVWIVKDCYEKCMYLMLKYQYQIPDLYYLFFNDFTFSLSQFPDGRIKDFWIKTNINFLHELLNVNLLEFHGPEGIKTLERMLDQGQIVMVQTVIERIPFWRLHQPDFDLQNFRPSHAFLVIGHDQEHYYYVDEKYNFNDYGFTPHPQNKEVGIAVKKDVRDAFNYVLRLFTVSLNEEKLPDLDNRFVLGIHMAVKNFRRGPVVVDNATEYCGREAIQVLIDICEAEKTQLTDQIFIANHFIDLQELIHWKIGADTIYRRQMLQKCLVKYFKNRGTEPPETLMTTICDLIKAWEKIKNTAHLRFKKRNYLLNSKMGEYFRDVQRLEIQLNHLLAEIFQVDV